MLVGHVPIELSSLMNNFLKASYSNKLVAKFLERENEKSVWLFQRNSNTGRAASGSQEKYTHIEIVHMEKSFKKFPVMY